MMKYEINYGNGVVVLPVSVIDKLDSTAEFELRVLLLLASDRDISPEMIALKLNTDVQAVDAAISYWRGAGVISSAVPVKEKKVARHASDIHYTGEELSKILDENGLNEIIDACGAIIGKVFTNTTEISRIAALNSYLGLDGEFILLLFSYCKEKGKTSLKYVEKTAYELYDKGIDSVEGLESYIRRCDELHSLENKLRTLFGMGDRSLTATEKKHFNTWFDEYNYGIEIITEAYDITVAKTGKLSLPYLSKILLNWHNKGFSTVEDVRASLAEYEKAKTEKKADSSSYDIDEFFELALKRSNEKMLKKK